MVQESTMICVDNSEWMRNGDYIPTRLQAEQDAANLIVQCKLRANPENAVGVLSMADEVRVLSTMTQESSKLFSKLHSIEPQGECQFLTAIKVAHLALKHRQNRNHKMRIVLFVGSPLAAVDKSELTKQAKKLKKEKVQMDIVCFGDPETDNASVLSPLIDTLNGKDGGGSNIVVVGPGARLTEVIASSPILRGEDGAGAPVVGAGGAFDFNEADDDPDLALALRVSLEEQRAREQAAAGEEQQGGGGGGAVGAPAAAPDVDVMDMDMGAMTEEQQLEWALRMSMQDTLPPADAAAAAAGAAAPSVAAAAAPATQQQEQPMEQDGEQPILPDDLEALMNNPDLIRQIIEDLPGNERTDRTDTDTDTTSKRTDTSKSDRE